MTYASFSHRYLPQIEKGLLDALSESFTDPRALVIDAARHSVLAGGKRVRPLLAIGSYTLFSDSEQPILPFAIALELFHTFCLIHDDLPALDNDTLRRGKPTCHIAYGEDIAILAGDLLLTLTVDVMVKQLPQYFPADKVLLGLSEFLDSAGVKGMVGGQVLDIKGSGREDGDYLKLMHAGKTGSLIISSLTIPALLAGADAKTIATIREYGDKLGLLFQVVDDILDVTQTKETLGKTPNKDAEQQKLTFVTLWGQDKASQIAKDLAQEAGDLISPLSKRHTFLCDIIPYLLTRES